MPIIDPQLLRNQVDAVFELKERDGKKCLWVGSEEDGFYDWCIDLSDLSKDELSVIEKIQSMVGDQAKRIKDGT